MKTMWKKCDIINIFHLIEEVLSFIEIQSPSSLCLYKERDSFNNNNKGGKNQNFFNYLNYINDFMFKVHIFWEGHKIL